MNFLLLNINGKNISCWTLPFFGQLLYIGYLLCVKSFSYSFQSGNFFSNLDHLCICTLKIVCIVNLHITWILKFHTGNLWAYSFLAKYCIWSTLVHLTPNNCTWYNFMIIMMWWCRGDLRKELRFYLEHFHYCTMEGGYLPSPLKF